MMKVDKLKRLGFNRSRRSKDNPKYNTVACDQCSALVINGVPCHEQGCPNARRGRMEP